MLVKHSLSGALSSLILKIVYVLSADCILLQVVIVGSGIQSPQLGLYALSRALSQKGIAKKIQVSNSEMEIAICLNVSLFIFRACTVFFF